MSESHEPSYSEQARIQDELLDARISDIRAWLDAGKITVSEAANLRVQAYSHHLLAVGDLNNEFFGEEPE